MYTFALFLVILGALSLTLRKNGVGSFVTLGIIGATIYSIPALADTQRSLSSIAFVFHGLVSVPTDVEFVVLIAWLALFAGLVISIFVFPKPKTAVPDVASTDAMKVFSVTVGILAVFGFLYLSVQGGSLLFFLQARDEQSTGPIATLWVWTAILGLVSASLALSRKLLIFYGLLLFVIFLRGDRTLIAIATAALIAVASYKDPRWYKRLRPLQIAGSFFGVCAVFLGKTIYITMKSALAGRASDRLSIPLEHQFLFQFEPLATFSHLEFVMRTGLTIGPMDFFTSVAGNLLMVPSFFGISTNLYNTTVSAKLSAGLGSGIAGNYLAHGWTVGGIWGCAVFYFILPLVLRLCDGQFYRREGAPKVFWCCVGAVLAFYIHRNGMDNVFSFVRQLFIICVATAGVAVAMRHFGVGSQLPRWDTQTARVQGGLSDDECTLAPPTPAKPASNFQRPRLPTSGD